MHHEAQNVVCKDKLAESLLMKLDPGCTYAALTMLVAVQTSLESANVTWEFTQFGKTVHAFTEPNLIGASASANVSSHLLQACCDLLTSALHHAEPLCPLVPGQAPSGT